MGLKLFVSYHCWTKSWWEENGTFVFNSLPRCFWKSLWVLLVVKSLKIYARHFFVLKYCCLSAPSLYRLSDKWLLCALLIASCWLFSPWLRRIIKNSRLNTLLTQYSLAFHHGMQINGKMGIPSLVCYHPDGPDQRKVDCLIVPFWDLITWFSEAFKNGFDHLIQIWSQSQTLQHSTAAKKNSSCTIRNSASDRRTTVMGLLKRCTLFTHGENIIQL